MVMRNMCFIILINYQYVNNGHANKQLVNIENCFLVLQTFLSCETKGDTLNNVCVFTF